VFNIINQRAGSVMKMAREKGYGVIARMPLQFGLLTGKLKSDAQLLLMITAVFALQEIFWILH